ncbi:hypothetical protein AB0I81_51475 [Nonomuraea sp. NPDC050404]|uniref:hypothetical protein n=1 Tax=Nonomuraea sp. NPDC050404 TaxID=3155783 RepID=UPI0034010EFA
MGSLPACVDIWHNSGWVTQTVYIKNTCSRRVGYVVEIAVIPDSHCIEVPRGKTKKYNWGKAWRWDGVHKCL